MRPIIKRIVDSNIFVLAVMFALGILQFGWIYFPPVGIINIILTGALYIGVVILGFYHRKTKPEIMKPDTRISGQEEFLE